MDREMRIHTWIHIPGQIIVVVIDINTNTARLETQSAYYVSPRRRYGSTVLTRSSEEVSRTYPSILSVWVGSSTTVMVEPFQVSMMRRPLSVVTRVHCFLRRAREKLWISWAKDCMTRLDTNKLMCSDDHWTDHNWVSLENELKQVGDVVSI